MTETIYIMVGSSGEFEEYRTWNSRAFKSETTAKMMANSANQWQNEKRERIDTHFRVDPSQKEKYTNEEYNDWYNMLRQIEGWGNPFDNNINDNDAAYTIRTLEYEPE